MQVELAAALMDTQGLASLEAEQAYARAFDLCQQVEQPEHLFPTLWGLHEVYLFQAKSDRARTMAELCMKQAERVQDPDLRLQAHHAMCGVLSLLSADEMELALAHAEWSIALYDPQHHHGHVFHYGGHDPGTCCLQLAAKLLWLLGYPEQAHRRGQEGVRLGYQLTHPFSLAHVLINIATLHVYRREIGVVMELTSTAIPIAREREIPFLLAEALILQGWALALQGEVERGITQIRQGIADWQALGTILQQPYHLLLFAEACQQAGDLVGGLAALDDALTAAYTSGERYLEAEIHRLRGQLSLAAGRPEGEAELAFQQAIQVARQQKTCSLELRASVSLSRLWQRQGRVNEAYQLLAEIYYWFSEGFETVDLQEAKALLEALHRAAHPQPLLSQVFSS